MNRSDFIVREGYWDERIEDQPDLPLPIPGGRMYKFSWHTRWLIRLIHGSEEKLPPPGASK
jgi:hypothetical protein